jgi:hypothetical protein
MPFDKNKFHLDWVWQKVISLCTSNWKKRKEKNNKHRAVSIWNKTTTCCSFANGKGIQKKRHGTVRLKHRAVQFGLPIAKSNGP